MKSIAKVGFFFVIAFFCLFKNGQGTLTNTLDGLKNVTQVLTTGLLHSRNYRSKHHEVLNAIRQRGKSWVAAINPDFEALNLTSFKPLLGGIHIDVNLTRNIILQSPPADRKLPPRHVSEGSRAKRGSLPSTYDVRTYYPNCKSLDSIRYQYKCSGCWAVTAASMMSDRHCIYNYQRTGQLYFSPVHILACVPYGCEGGQEFDAYDYWVRKGLVTGGTAYTPASQPEGCLPYPYNMAVTPSACPTTCTTSKNFTADIVKGGKWYNWWFPSIDKIKQEIYSYGPVTAFFTVYDDFFYYKSGVYEQTYGNKAGYHLTKLIGWGTENGTDYWLAVNTWGTNWGQNGLFKIRRGNNTVGVEARISAALPKEAF